MSKLTPTHKNLIFGNMKNARQLCLLKLYFAGYKSEIKNALYKGEFLCV